MSITHLIANLLGTYHQKKKKKKKKGAEKTVESLQSLAQSRHPTPLGHAVLSRQLGFNVTSFG
jgi:hypothetical protein